VSRSAPTTRRPSKIASRTDSPRSTNTLAAPIAVLPSLQAKPTFNVESALRPQLRPQHKCELQSAQRGRPYFVADTRGTLALGSTSRSKTLSRMDVGRTAFGMPRWEPSRAESDAALEARLQKVEVVLGMRDAPASPLRRFRTKPGEKPLLPRWMLSPPQQQAGALGSRRR
jgi:hypothetical protein